MRSESPNSAAPAGRKLRFLSAEQQQRYAAEEDRVNTQLDFALLPTVERASLLSGLDRSVESRMQALGFLSETLDRARGAAMLFHQAHGKLESWKNEAFIRGGLSEFASVFGALTRDLLLAGRPEAAHGETDSQNPLLHLMSLMRDIGIHLSAFEVSTHDTQVIFYAGDDEQEHTITTAIVSNLTVNLLLKKREAKKYNRLDLERVVAWFNDKQKVFGAAHILVQGVGAYCEEIQARYRQAGRITRLQRTADAAR